MKIDCILQENEAFKNQTGVSKESAAGWWYFKMLASAPSGRFDISYIYQPALFWFYATLIYALSIRKNTIYIETCLNNKIKYVIL